MQTHAEIINEWPSIDALSQDVGEQPTTVRKWKARDSIPGRYWAPMEKGAVVRQIRGVTVSLLAEIAAKEID